MPESTESRSNPPLPSAQYLTTIQKAKFAPGEGTHFTYTPKDLLLYALSLHVSPTTSNLPLIYEQHPQFQALPTWGAIPFFNTTLPYHISDFLPNFSSTRVVHGEHKLEILKHPIPTAATLVTYPKLVDVVDKGTGALVTTIYTTLDERTGEMVFRNEFVQFARGCGGFDPEGRDRQRRREKKGREGSVEVGNGGVYRIPSREPDAVVQEATTTDQAALYRLNGDWNPLHIDPEFSSQGGYEIPILHGLAFFGISGKHIFQKYGAFSSIKVRFAGIVIPGQTLRTEMWKEGQTIIFQTSVVETGKLCLSQAGAELLDNARDSKL